MSTISIAKSRNAKSAGSKKVSAKSTAPSRRKITPGAANAKTLSKADEPELERLTKQERVLTLLSQPDGSSIEEMIQATNWQQHSVRGFLAGTVKKKLGFPLYIIEAQRRRSPLPHRNAARSLTWTKWRSMSQRRSRGSRR